MSDPLTRGKARETQEREKWRDDRFWENLFWGRIYVGPFEAQGKYECPTP